MVPGRPVRFLYLVLGLWIAGRAGVLLTQTGENKANGSGNVLSAQRNIGAAGKSAFGTVLSGGKSTAPIAAGTAAPTIVDPPKPMRIASASPANNDPAKGVPVIAESRAPGEVPNGIFNRPPGFPPAIAADRPGPSGKRDRWSLSAWMLYRPENREAGLASGGQLGASQAGARLAYDLSPSSSYRLAIHGRVSSALESPLGAEAALGLTWRPVRSVPIALSIERRVAIAEGGRNAFAAYAAGGIGPMPLAPGIELEGYGQAGLVGAARRDAFADGRIAVAGKLLDKSHGVAIMAGVALSGGAQPLLSRLDLGPQLAARFPIGGGYARAALEWRERIAGSARPASGPALVLAADF
jgi:hypothetical protein